MRLARNWGSWFDRGKRDDAPVRPAAVEAPPALAGGTLPPGLAGWARELAHRGPACPFCARVRLNRVRKVSCEQHFSRPKGRARPPGRPTARQDRIVRRPLSPPTPGTPPPATPF